MCAVERLRMYSGRAGTHPWTRRDHRVTGRTEDAVTDQDQTKDPAADEHLDESTREADRADAGASAHADRMPTEEEERLAERSADQVDVDAVGEAYEEMAEKGADAKGEGRITG